MSDHFGFRVISGWVGLVIGSSSVGLFGFRVVSVRVGSVIGSFRVSDRIRSDRIGYRVI
jgi:hypothetical protein